MSSGRRLRLLVIDEEFPYPLNTGKRIRTFSLIKVLARFDDIAYLAYGHADSESCRALEALGVKCHAVRPVDRRQKGAGFYLRLFSNLLSPLPYIVTSHYTRRFEDRLSDLLEQRAYDLLICEWTPYAVYLRSRPSVRSIIIAHNIEADIWCRYEETERHLHRRAYISIQRRKVEAYERTCFSWSQGAIAVTDADAERIAGHGVTYPVRTIENGVDLQYFRPRDDEVDPDMLVFTGSMDWRPNQDAVEFFVKEILPVVRRERPNVRFVAVGRQPPQRLRDLEREHGVTITGTVDDVRPFIAKAALFVVPLRIGGGSRLKILEALAMEKLVLSTTVGAEGLAVMPGRDVILADGAEGFAREALRCLEDRVRMEQIARAGRSLVESQYGWDRLGEEYQRYLVDVVGSGDES